MDHLFSECSILKSFPDISKWIDNVKNIDSFFENCLSLTYLPDISKCNVYNININNIIKGCSSLLIYPNFQNWNMNSQFNVKDIISNMSSLSSEFILSNSLNFETSKYTSNSEEKNFSSKNVVSNYNLDILYDNQNDSNDYYENFYN